MPLGEGREQYWKYQKWLEIIGVRGDVLKLLGKENKNISMEHVNERQEMDEKKHIIMKFLSILPTWLCLQIAVLGFLLSTQPPASILTDWLTYSDTTLAPLLAHLGERSLKEHSAISSSRCFPSGQVFLPKGMNGRQASVALDRLTDAEVKVRMLWGSDRNWALAKWWHIRSIPRQRNVWSSAL